MSKEGLTGLQVPIFFKKAIYQGGGCSSVGDTLAQHAQVPECHSPVLGEKSEKKKYLLLSPS